MGIVNQVFRILDSFNVPASQGEDRRTGKAKENPLPPDTQFTVDNDTKNLVTYYHTIFNRRVGKIDLKKINFKGGGVRKIPLEQKRSQGVKG